MSAALVLPSGTVRQLDRPAEADAQVTAEDVQDAEKLARMVQDLRRDVARLTGAWSPRTVTFVDITTAGSLATPQTHRLVHGFGGRVWWTVVSLRTGGTDFRLDVSTSTTNDVLVLTSYSTGTFSLRIEAAG